MVEVKISFTKTGVEEISDPSMPANVKALELKVISTDAIVGLNKIYEKVPLLSYLEKISVAFFDGAETKIYSDLLNDNKVSFELIWEKEKVNFRIPGIEDPGEDDTKLEVSFFSQDKSLQIGFKPQFANIIKITSTSEEPPSPDNSSLDKQITNLKNQIKALEEKIGDPSNSNSLKEQYQQQIQELKTQLEEKEKERRSRTEKNNFPTAWVIGISAGVVILILVVTLLFQRNRNKRN